MNCIPGLPVRLRHGPLPLRQRAGPLLRAQRQGPVRRGHGRRRRRLEGRRERRLGPGIGADILRGPQRRRGVEAAGAQGDLVLHVRLRTVQGAAVCQQRVRCTQGRARETREMVDSRKRNRQEYSETPNTI